MAAADYRLCDVCEAKTFYDAELNYEFGGAEISCRNGGDMVLGQELQGLGDWIVICKKCAQTHEIVLQPKSNTSSAA